MTDPKNVPSAAHPSMLARRIARVIEGSRINVSTEASAHASVSSTLTNYQIRHELEAVLSPKERIDILAGEVGIEVKVKGSRRDIYRQLERYAAIPEIRALVLVTGVAWPSNVTNIGGKPLFLASLHKGWL